MAILDNFLSIYLLYFLYGLTFLFLGASIALKDMKASRLKIAKSLWLLSVFGFTHGIHEWTDLFLLSDRLPFPDIAPYAIRVFALILMGVSFLFLLLFGLSLIFSINKNKYIKGLIPLSIIMFFMMAAAILGIESSRNYPGFFSLYNNISRMFFGFTGSFAASSGLILYSQKVRKISTPISRYFLLAGIGFAFYGVFAGLTPSNATIPMLPIPVELFRGICAGIIMYCLFKALNIVDIDTRRKLEEQLRNQARSEKMVSLGLLSAGVAHEINSPLTNASLNMEMLKSQFKEILNEKKIQKRLDAIERNIDRASMIAKDLLQFSQTQETILTPMDVHQVIDSAFAQLGNKLLNVRIIREKERLPDVRLNAAKLEQVFVNVVNNSIEAMTDQPELIIKTRKLKNEVQIIISDNGTGILTEHWSKVFDPFFTTKKNNKGTGLGLSICHGIMEQHNGTITLESNQKGGVDTIINLPVR